MSRRCFWVYIVASQTRVIYVGVTNDLVRRIDAHQKGLVPGFTSKYRIRRLVYYEHAQDAHSAIAREKQLKGWRRSKKLHLIAQMNPAWNDLYDSTAILAMRE